LNSCRQLGCQGFPPPHSGHWQDVVHEDHCSPPEERLPVRILSSEPNQTSSSIFFDCIYLLLSILSLMFLCIRLVLSLFFIVSALALPPRAAPRSKSLRPMM
jgi:hypothetical protein